MVTSTIIRFCRLPRLVTSTATVMETNNIVWTELSSFLAFVEGVKPDKGKTAYNSYKKFIKTAKQMLKDNGVVALPIGEHLNSDDKSRLVDLGMDAKIRTFRVILNNAIDTTQIRRLRTALDLFSSVFDMGLEAPESSESSSPNSSKGEPTGNPLYRISSICKLYHEVMMLKGRQFLIFYLRKNVLNVEFSGILGETYNSFMTKIQQSGECRYGVFNYGYEHEGVMKNENIGIVWLPNTANETERKSYGAAFDAYNDALFELNKVIRANDVLQITFQSVEIILNSTN